MLSAPDRQTELEYFQSWIREHQPEAYADFLRYGNRYEVDDPDPSDDSAFGLGAVESAGDAITIVLYLGVRVLKRGWRWLRARGTHVAVKG
jgi:hypothetical protein